MGTTNGIHKINTTYYMDMYNEYPYNQLFIGQNGIILSHDTYLEIQNKLNKRRKNDDRLQTCNRYCSIIGWMD